MKLFLFCSVIFLNMLAIPQAGYSQKLTGAASERKSSKELYRLGVALREECRYREAFRMFEEVYRRYHDSFEGDLSAHMAALCQKELGNIKQAAVWFGRVVSDYPSSNLASDALNSLAEIFLECGDYEGARKSYRLILDRYPDSFWAARARDWLQKNEQFISENIRLTGLPESEPAEKKKKTGEESGNRSGGKRAPVFVDYGGLDDKIYLTALDLHKAGKLDEAIRLYERIAIEYPASRWLVNSYYMLGECYLEQGNMDYALKMFSRAALKTEDNPFLVPAMRRIGDLCFIKEDYRMAARSYEMVLKLGKLKENEKRELLFLTGECYNALGEFKKASTIYASIFSDSDEMMNDRSDIEDSLNRIVSGASSPPPVYDPVAWRYYLEGVKLMQEGKYPEAKLKIEKALEERPSFPEGLWAKALIAYRFGEKSEATGCLEHLLALDNENIRAHSFLAFLHYEAGRYEEAMKEYLEVVRLSPEGELAKNARLIISRLKKRGSTK